MSDGYEILALDDLERVPYRGSGQVLRPLRRTLGLGAFGANVWTADNAGDKLIPPHEEESGHEELYVVVRGTARFTVGDETEDAPAGTLIHVMPETFRTATAAEPNTMVLAVGGKEGEPYHGYPWEEVHVAFARLDAGDVAGGRAIMEANIHEGEHAWGGHYNLACYLAIAGESDAALEELRIARELNAENVMRWLPHDTDLDSLRSDPRFEELAQ
jgi:mannose-6-phosphate isomerase-like protein (cupin superfamily)